MKVIETKRLKLIGCDKQILEAAIEGNGQLGKLLLVTVPDNWTEFGIGAFQYSLKQLELHQEDDGWLTYFPIYKQDHTLIGSGGYKGRPSADGTVEIGYEIAIAYRNNGFATEMTKALVAHAFEDEKVVTVIAHTLAEYNASCKVLSKCGFATVQELSDPDDGLIWKWELKRIDWQQLEQN